MSSINMQKEYKKIKKVVFPVGGMGTRFLPVTKALPKEMLPVANKPLIQYAFEEAVNAGIEQFIFVTGRNKNAISNHFDHSYELQKILTEKEKQEELQLTRDWLPSAGQIAFVRQQNPLGLGHAIWCARNFIGDDPFAVILADEMLMSERGFLSDMCALYEQVGGNIIAVADIDRSLSNNYGIVDPIKDDGRVVTIKSLIEKPEPALAPSTISITGRYILQPEIFSYLSNAKVGVGGEIQLTDSMNDLRSPLYGLRFSGPRFDCGNYLGFLEANIAYSLKHYDINEILKKYLQP
jgi:UTP--glucose-1-phosphate uridylyltransferase